MVILIGKILLLVALTERLLHAGHEVSVIDKQHGLIDDKDLIKFVLYTDQSGMWRIQAVTVEGQAFENRLSLPEKWRGVRDADLEKIAGIEGCTFCHAAGFIGGNKSFEGVLQMARVALQQGGDVEMN